MCKAGTNDGGYWVQNSWENYVLMENFEEGIYGSQYWKNRED